MRTVRRAFLSLSVLCVGSWMAAPAVAAAQQVAVPEDAVTVSLDQPTPVSPDLVQGELANGLRYFIRENHEPENRAELRLVVKAGSILEEDSQRGLAHVLEHMAFNGSENFEEHELLDFMESIGMRLGPDVNAYTSFDETVYMLQIPTDSAGILATSFQILEDWAHGLTLDGDEIDQERGVVTEEWRLGQGAGARLRDQQLPVIFRGSRYADRLPIGTVESLESFEHEALRSFYRDWYRPDLMAVIAVGSFDAADVESMVRDHFGDLAAPSEARDRPSYDIPDHDETLFTIATDPEMPQTSVSVYHMMDYEDDWTIGGYRQRIVERLYNGMLNNRLAELARRPDPPFLGAASGNGRLVAQEGVYQLTALVPEDGLIRGLEALLAEAERVDRFGFTETELERLKTNALRGMERSVDNRNDRPSAGFAAEYQRAFLYGESTPGIEYEYELYKRFLPEISLEEVNRVGRSWIREENRVVVVSAPEKEGLVPPTESELLAVLSGVDDTEVTPYEDTVTDQPLLETVPEGSAVVATRTHGEGITEWELGNGVRVFVKPTDFREDQVLISSFSPGGLSLASDEDYPSARASLALIVGGGLGAFNAVDLQKVLTGKAASVVPYLQTYGEGLTGSASSRDLETLFQLIYLRFTAPRADQEYFQSWLTRSRESLANRDASPLVAFNDAYNRIMSQDHPRSRPTTVEMLDQVDLARAFAFFQDRFADASDQVFVFVGSVELEALKPLVERYLGALPVTGREETWRDTGMRRPRGVIEETVRKGLEPQGQTRITFSGPFDYDDRDERMALAGLAMTLEDRLREVLREELGGTYSVNVSQGSGSQPVGSYSLSISFGSDPDRADELVDAVFRELELMKAEGTTEEQVADVRETLLRSYETSLEDNLFWRDQIQGAVRRGMEPAAEILSYPASVRTLTPAVVQRAAGDYLDIENYVRVTLRPEGSQGPGR